MKGKIKDYGEKRHKRKGGNTKVRVEKRCR